MGPWCGQMGIGDWAGMVAIWVVVLALVLWGVSRLFPAREDSTARAILDARLASGELDSQTYRMLRRELDDADVLSTKGTS